jgi:hypothetical protein
MQPGSSINPSTHSRSPDVSRNTSNIPQIDVVDAVNVLSNQPVQDNQQQQTTHATARSVSLSYDPDPVGSFAPPLVMAPTTTVARHQRLVSDHIVCGRCGLSHLIEV